MSHESRKHNRNGTTRVHVLPTTERLESQRPHNLRSSIVNTPDPIVYGISFVLITFGVTFVIIGGVFIKKCQLQPLIPIWLLLMGFILTFAGGWHGIYVKGLKKEPFKRITSMQKTITWVIVLIYLGWFIAGHIFVYGAWRKDPDLGHLWFENGCNKSLFNLSFAAMIVMDSLIGFFLIGLCFWGLTKVVVRE